MKMLFGRQISGFCDTFSSFQYLSVCFKNPVVTISDESIIYSDIFVSLLVRIWRAQLFFVLCLARLIFRNVPVVNKNVIRLSRHEWKSRWNGAETSSFFRPSSSTRQAKLFIGGGTCTRSYRFPINRSVEQILPRVLFRSPSSVPRRDRV